MRDEAGNLASNRAMGIDWPGLVCHLNTFLTIFVLFLVTVNSPTPWSFAESIISRPLVAEFFIGTR